jgi:peptidoglycan/LPS O-acetylase OafA/YrhL
MISLPSAPSKYTLDGRSLLSHPRLQTKNFDLLRVLFAGAVCLVHSYELSGFRELAPIVKVMSSAVAVKAFFVLSGFLIFMSYERSHSLSGYAGKRVRRIYPAYFVTIVLCAVGLASLSTLPIREYFSIEWRKYILYNLAFLNSLHPTLPGVFESNPIPLVNGSLWTIRIEALFYCRVPFLAFLFRRVSHLSILALVYCLSVGSDALIAFLVSRISASVYLELARELLTQLRYFMAGAVLFYFLPAFERRVTWFVTFAVLILIVNLRFPAPLLEPLALAVTVVFFGLYCFAGNFSKYGDFSRYLHRALSHNPARDLFRLAAAESVVFPGRDSRCNAAWLDCDVAFRREALSVAQQPLCIGAMTRAARWIHAIGGQPFRLTVSAIAISAARPVDRKRWGENARNRAKHENLRATANHGLLE